MENIQMEKVTYLKRIYFSIFKISNCKLFINEPVRKAIFYIFLVCLIFGSIAMIKPIYDYNKLASNLFVRNQSKIPNYELKDGTLKVEGNQPIVINEKEYILVIDTISQDTRDYLNKDKDEIIVMKNQLIYKIGDQKKVLNFRKDFNLNKQAINNRFIFLLRTFSIFIILRGIISLIITSFLNLIIISLVSLFVSGMRRIVIKYRDNLKISAYAMTASTIIYVIANSGISLYIPYFWIVYYLICIIYISKILNTIDKDASKVLE